MAISFVAASSGTNGNTTAAFNVAKPAGTAENDVLVAFVVATTIYSVPSGWLFITNTSGNPFSSRFVHAWYRVAGPSEPATYELRPASGTPHSDAGGIIALRGADIVDPIDGSSTIVNTVAGTSVVLPSITTTVDGDMLLGLAGGHANTSWTAPGTMTEQWDNKSAGSSPVSSTAANELFGAAGATGTRTFTANSSTTNAGILVAVKPGCIPIHPGQLFIPHKDRLVRLASNFTDAGIAMASEAQFGNLKTVERWAGAFMVDTLSADKCLLFIPYKNHSREPWLLSASQSFENWKVIERWAGWILDGSCGCSCTPQRLPDRCRLDIPFKNSLLSITDPTDLVALARIATQEFASYKTLEDWANTYARGDCGCTD